MFRGRGEQRRPSSLQPPRIAYKTCCLLIVLNMRIQVPLEELRTSTPGISDRHIDSMHRDVIRIQLLKSGFRNRSELIPDFSCHWKTEVEFRIEISTRIQPQPVSDC